MEPLLLTLEQRPYVVVFLLTFAVLAVLHFGFLRMIAWALWGYGVSFLSEYASVRTGFPYGLYHYLPESFAGELQLAGIPVWDSASYVFIAFAAYATAWFCLEPRFGRFKIAPHLSPSRPIAVPLTGALLMMLADMVIDPVANRGGEWFLGKIYTYPEGGIYFGVPLSNFAGWLLTGLVILFGFQLLEKFIFTPIRLPARGSRRFAGQAVLGPLFYFGILVFMLAVTFMIGAFPLFWASLGITVAAALWTSFQGRFS